MILLAPSFKFVATVSCNRHMDRVLRYITTTQYPLLAGHSKWANIRHIKAAKDGQKAALFNKISRQIRLAILEGGGSDPARNSHLRSILEDASRNNMPTSSIQNIIKKSEGKGAAWKKYRIDMRYKKNVFIICTLYTEHFAKFRMDIAGLLRKSGAAIVDRSRLFEEYGVIQAIIDQNRIDDNKNIEDIITEDAIECGADDVEVCDSEQRLINFICDPESLLKLRNLIKNKGYTIENADIYYHPVNTVKLLPEERQLYDKFVNSLQEHGIEEVFDNIANDAE